METTYGTFNPEGGKGLLRAVHFPSLATVGVETPDGRLLAEGGGATRELPVSIMAQFQTMPGHMTAEIVGPLQQVTFHDDGNIEGWGWLVDTDEGRKMEILLEAEALRQNSVDLADVKAEIKWKSDDPNDPDFWEYTITFSEYKIATTTFVNIPAFPEAHGELMASFDRSQPLEVRFEATTFEMIVNEDEVTADGAPVVPWADFHLPEARRPTPITIDEHGVISGHLAEWRKCHDGIDGRCQLAPRPADYSGFHEPGVLTDRGMVETGPMFLLGGHPDKPLGTGDRWKAYGGIENAVGDVRVTNGVHGPWVSGRVRPGTSSEAIYAARASRKSGHWRRDGSLAAIVFVNVPGYKVPGSTLSFDSDGGVIEDGELMELVASLRAFPPDPLRDAELQRAEMADVITKALNESKLHSMTWQPNGTFAIKPDAMVRYTSDDAVPAGETMTGTIEYTVVDTTEVTVELTDEDPDDDDEVDDDQGDEEVETEAAALELELELTSHLPFKP